ncbi:TPA: type I 3-dehydroquinate dehydratase [Streptococcus pyogenes]|uniref:type I 3-dehydroquinate dehydratase n=1 Tax=Streptococcus pyogenes TaxID=1314 RepID=UPI0003C783AD|nr:type I 3-dehydroquinate dehydratase [Streptococcus pyogenes]HER4571414.1 type I 3-dehydroquinate dehydratase [Streptococcus pyogenes NGAS641]HER4600478.1 type I 3-dehydroquinate dehydratase [Streptococcus pyogenes NGAS625]HER4628962.1 type I 3-dehydroquinate dehydratase [Streptococcus pyogenes NGAS599]HER4652234.1 type I 3-dehydroquinate dehydratase [Streptococcus pyogenes NGAS500]HER4669532.1 type I 3-dehydroquinate dehydratase [Streptococcus pyogenes NGAS438]HER4685433.1 type I 3-dehydro
MRIVAPVMPRHFDEAQAIDISKYEDVNLIEWRADFLPKDEIVSVAPAIFEKFAGKEIIFTLRTVQEGGNITLSSQEYVDIIKEINAIYNPDYIDFEYFTHKSVFQEMLDFPNLILSYHNFEETPENLMEAFSEMTKLAPRVVKIAVMPQSEQDVLDLMNYTRGFKTLNPEQEFATISMGKLGRLSRFAGDVIGSSWTYVSLDHVSGPGQVTLNDMKRIIEVLEMDISN